MSSERDREYLFRVLFRLEVHQSQGDAFQGLFSTVMKYTDPRFQRIEPWGNWGDGGNDGWIAEDGHYFQVYGPKATTSHVDSCTTALAKAIDDFAKLPKKWMDVRRYTFVMNDRFQGIPAPIDNDLQKLAKDRALERAASLAMLDLLMMFMKLGEGERQDIIGHVPDVDVDILDPSAVGTLLFNLANHASAKLAFLHDTAPDFEEKIKFNGLTPPVSFRLQRASYQVALVDEFLTEHDLGLRQAIAQDIKGFYEKSKDEIPDTVDGAANERYTRMIERLIPDTPKHPHSMVAYVTAAEAILAKYFETCDAYEHPTSAPAP
jgi:hypothetical protein